jgi:hypothetical protein
MSCLRARPDPAKMKGCFGPAECISLKRAQFGAPRTKPATGRQENGGDGIDARRGGRSSKLARHGLCKRRGDLR